MKKNKRKITPRSNKWEKSLKQILLLIKQKNTHISINEITSKINISPDMYYNSKTYEWCFVRKVLLLANDLQNEVRATKKSLKNREKISSITDKILDDFLMRKIENWNNDNKTKI